MRPPHAAETALSVARASLVLLFAISTPAISAPPTSAPTTSASSCLTCHGDQDLFDGNLQAIVQNFADDVHSQVGLSCQDCHGGNPDPSVADDMDAAMDSGFAENPYHGAPARAEIPGLCGKCHSDPEFMRRFKPDPRIDQEEEYWTSHHGKGLARGDGRVATCVDCHGVHQMRRPADPTSPVFPRNVAHTCGRCHSDPEHMKGTTLENGLAIPVDQVARWERSVHANAMFEKDDLSAPTCNDCHGNHGAAPPGVESVAYVCGQCHGREATLFRASPKQAGFQDHNEMIADEQASACSDCHEAPEPQASLTRIHSFTECSTCHENHAVVRPTIALLGPLPETPCSFCHENSLLETAATEPRKIREHYEELRSQLLDQAETLGLEGNDRFDWLVDQALQLPTHTNPSAEAESGTELRPEFQRLFEKFRIGKTHYKYTDPTRGEEVTAAVTRCNDCHLGRDDDSAGGSAASYFLEGMRDLTLLTAQAERVLLAASRGGVETSEALPELDQAVSAQIELQVLVHTFSDAPDGPFAKKHEAGMEHARAALAAGQDALAELSHRRTGLVTSLVFIVLVLVALALRIRQAAMASSPGSP